VHATLMLDEIELTGVDTLPGSYQRPQGFFVTVTIDDVTRAHEVFNSLSQGGAVQMPFSSTFWSPGFGVFVDRFNIPWEINANGGQVDSVPSAD
jgi:PhnB protein